MIHPELAAQKLAAKGRGGDTEVAHLTRGEVVMPAMVLAQMNPTAVSAAFQRAGLDMGRYTVGGDDDSRNPATGMREYWVGGADGDFGGDPGYGGGGDADDGGGEGGSLGIGDVPAGQPGRGQIGGTGSPGEPGSGGGGEGAADAPTAFMERERNLRGSPRTAPSELEMTPGQRGRAETREEARERVAAEIEGSWGWAANMPGAIGALASIAKGATVATATPGMVDADTGAYIGEVPGGRVADRSAQGPEPSDAGSAADDTLPGDSGAPQTEAEPTPDANAPESVLADVTPWEGVPEITQAALPEGWLGQAQGRILAAHQSAARLGAW